MIKKTIITFFVTFFYLNNAHGSENLTVSVASSLYNVSHELAREWEKTSNKKVIIISGSTSLLARQIERGQKSDVIITANYSWLKWMIDKNLIEKNIDELAKLVFLYLPKLHANRPSRLDWSKDNEPVPLIIPSILSN